MGYIIVITGTDGCGKQTQSEILCDKLKSEGYNVIRQSFPNYDSRSSEPVKMYLSGEFGESDMSLDAYQASSLYAIDRLCTYNKSLKDFYQKGGIIVFDRYVESNMLHQAGKINNILERDRFLEWLDDFEYGKLKLPRPNKTIFLDVDIDVSIQLARSRDTLKNQSNKDIHENNTEHLYHAYNAGKYVCNKFGWDKINCVNNGKLRTIEDISNEIFDIVRDKIK